MRVSERNSCLDYGKECSSEAQSISATVDDVQWDHQSIYWIVASIPLFTSQYENQLIGVGFWQSYHVFGRLQVAQNVHMYDISIHVYYMTMPLKRYRMQVCPIALTAQYPKFGSVATARRLVRRSWIICSTQHQCSSTFFMVPEFQRTQLWTTITQAQHNSGEVHPLIWFLLSLLHRI